MYEHENNRDSIDSEKSSYLLKPISMPIDWLVVVGSYTCLSLAILGVKAKAATNQYDPVTPTPNSLSLTSFPPPPLVIDPASMSIPPPPLFTLPPPPLVSSPAFLNTPPPNLAGPSPTLPPFNPAVMPPARQIPSPLGGNSSNSQNGRLFLYL